MDQRRKRRRTLSSFWILVWSSSISASERQQEFRFFRNRFVTSCMGLRKQDSHSIQYYLLKCCSFFSCNSYRNSFSTCVFQKSVSETKLKMVGVETFQVPMNQSFESKHHCFSPRTSQPISIRQKEWDQSQPAWTQVSRFLNIRRQHGGAHFCVRSQSRILEHSFTWTEIYLRRLIRDWSYVL